MERLKEFLGVEGILFEEIARCKKHVNFSSEPSNGRLTSTSVADGQ